MNIKKAYFLKSCVKNSQFPEYAYPEFAFFGRSNVGKSSLLNMLLSQKNLVKTGSRPGVTQTINFFIVNDNTSFADLPGIGYAKLPKSIKKQFAPMIKSYITSRDNLRLAFLLVDARRTPGDYEQDLINLLVENEIPVAITLTKCDKLSKNELSKSISNISKTLNINADSIFITSSKTNAGRKELLSLIDDFSSGKQSKN
ncbi:MAG TPA: ribosome biogenesis GTP-binding protein YihA/YsxC [Spirochaetota bacterium]|nr:ribosome biogenesis GTP-binding protein YihA/YsxC [Spirochaetota bacterium]HPJ33598.1 ribosome biogenesis GTP-binding protein YihA/YsxC [Spirochaetota bacterium]